MSHFNVGPRMLVSLNALSLVMRYGALCALLPHRSLPHPFLAVGGSEMAEALVQDVVKLLVSRSYG